MENEQNAVDSSLDNVTTSGVIQDVIPAPQSGPPPNPHGQPLFHFHKLAFIITAASIAAIVLVGVASLWLFKSHPSQQADASVIQAGNYSVQHLTLSTQKGYTQLLTGSDQQLQVNGQLQVSDNLTLSPSSKPVHPTTGQIYYDKQTNQPYFYNGSSFLSLGQVAGVTGPRGPAGAGGINGLNGAAGAVGLQGATGPVGPAGAGGSGTTDASLLTTGTLADARLGGDVALVDRDNQVFTGGAQMFKNAADSTAAFQIQNALGTSTLLKADTINNVVTNSGSLVVEAPGTATVNCNYTNYVNAANSLSPDSYWMMEDAGTTAADSTGNGNTGTLHNVTPTQIPGPISCANTHPAMSFNGTTSYIDTAHHTLNNPPTYTEVVMFKTTSDGPIMSLGDGANFDRIIYVGTDGKLYAATYDGNDQYIRSSATVNDGQWHEAAAVFSTTSGMSLYLDGNLVASNPAYTSFDGLSNEYWQFGTTPWIYYINSVQFYNGEIGQATTFPAVLSSADIHNLAVAGGFAGLNPTSPPATLTVEGSALFQTPTTNATVLDVDTANNMIGIGTSAPAATLDINGTGANYVTQWSEYGNQLGYLDNTGNLYLTGNSGNNTVGFTNNEHNKFALNPADYWQVDKGYNQQIVSYYGLQIDANSQGGFVPAMASGSLGNPSVSIYGGQPTAPVVALQGAPSQTGDILDINNSTATLAKFTASGSLNITGNNPGFYTGACNYTNYVNTINGLSPTSYWKLEDVGATAADSSGSGNTGTLNNVTVNQTPGSFNCASAHPVMSFNGTNSNITTTNAYSDPTTYSEIALFRTTNAGPIVSFDDGSTFDRILYVGTDGKLYAGMYDGSAEVINSPGAVNDGYWHEAVSIESPGGMYLYVDGNLVAFNASYTTPDNINGKWKIGTGLFVWGGFPNSTQYFNGEIGQVAIVPSVLSGGDIASLNSDRGSYDPTQSLAVLGDTLLQTSTNSASAFQIQDSTGTNLFTADTTNNWVGVGNITQSSSYGKFSLQTGQGYGLEQFDTAEGVRLGTWTGWDSGITGLAGEFLTISNHPLAFATNNQRASFALGTNGAATFINNADSATAFQIQNSTGSSLLTADTTNMTLTVQALTVNVALTVNGHIITGNSSGSTSVTNGAQATCTLTGNDTGGTLQIVTSGTPVSGTQCTVNFANAFAAAPNPVISPKSANAIGLFYTGTVGTGSFTVDTSAVPAGGATFKLNYFNAQ